MNKRGSVFDIIIWIVLAFLTLFIFAGLVYMFGQVHTGLLSVGTAGEVNVTNITTNIFAPTMNSLATYMNWIVFLIIAGGAFSIMIHNFLVRQHPAWLILYILITIVAIIVSAYVSNQYVAMYSNDALGSTLQGFTMGNFIMENLPYWSAIIGIVGGIFLFIGALRDRETAGGFA